MGHKAKGYKPHTSLVLAAPRTRWLSANSWLPTIHAWHADRSRILPCQPGQRHKPFPKEYLMAKNRPKHEWNSHFFPKKWHFAEILCLKVWRIYRIFNFRYKKLRSTPFLKNPFSRNPSNMWKIIGFCFYIAKIWKNQCSTHFLIHFLIRFLIRFWNQNSKISVLIWEWEIKPKKHWWFESGNRGQSPRAPTRPTADGPRHPFSSHFRTIFWSMFWSVF